MSNIKAIEEQNMPHVIVKLTPGKSERQKRDLTDTIVEAVTGILNYGEESVSVAFEEVEMEDWKEQVFTPDIVGRPGRLTKKPGYTM